MNVIKLEGYEGRDLNAVNYNPNRLRDFVKAKLETNCMKFKTAGKALKPSVIYNELWQVHDGYIIYDAFNNNVWYIQSGWHRNKRLNRDEIDSMSDVKEYTEKQWKRLNA